MTREEASKLEGTVTDRYASGMGPAFQDPMVGRLPGQSRAQIDARRAANLARHANRLQPAPQNRRGR